MGDTIRYLALGDSYTIGEGVPDEGRWPSRLTSLLHERGVPVEPPEIIARTGWTTDELEAAIAEADPRGPFDLVSLLIGVNDQYRGRPVDEYRPRLEALIDTAIGLANGAADRVIVLSIPDWGVTPFAAGRDRAAVAAEIDGYNSAKREITDARAARFVDIAPLSRRVGARAEMLAGDGLHPSAALYDRWATLVLPDAMEGLGRA